MQKKDLAVIDIELGKKLAAGREDIALEMIALLKAELLSEFLIIAANFKEPNFIAMKDNIHKLHGAVSYCGVPALKQAILDLENAFSDPSHQKITENFEIFERAVHALLSDSHE